MRALRGRSRGRGAGEYGQVPIVESCEILSSVLLPSFPDLPPRRLAPRHLPLSPGPSLEPRPNPDQSILPSLCTLALLEYQRSQSRKLSISKFPLDHHTLLPMPRVEESSIVRRYRRKVKLNRCILSFENRRVLEEKGIRDGWEVRPVVDQKGFHARQKWSEGE